MAIIGVLKDDTEYAKAVVLQRKVRQQLYGTSTI